MAARLYSVVLQFDWTVNGEWTINPANGAIAIGVAPSVGISNKTTNSPSVAVTSTSIEVRFPTALRLLSRDQTV